MRIAITLAITFAATATAHADDACDHGVAVADAQSALLVAPHLFGTVGYVKAGPDNGSLGPGIYATPRVSAGVAYRLDGLFAASAVRGRARAECRRTSALAGVAAGPARAALAARVKVLDGALAEADAMLRKTQAEVAEHVGTEKDLVMLRLRVDSLRRAAAAVRSELATTPAGPTGTLASYYAADAEVETAEARLRRLDAFTVSVRAGYDRYLDRDDDAPFFAMLTVDLNTGVLFAGGAQDRAAAARKRMVRTEVATAIATFDAQLVADAARLAELAPLITDVEAQLERLARLGGDDGRRERNTLWFDLVELRAEQASTTARVAALHEVLAR